MTEPNIIVSANVLGNVLGNVLENVGKRAQKCKDVVGSVPTLETYVNRSRTV